MKRTTKYVGLDVHQAMTVATVRSEGGRVIARSVVETSAEITKRVLRSMVCPILSWCPKSDATLRENWAQEDGHFRTMGVGVLHWGFIHPQSEFSAASL